MKKFSTTIVFACTLMGVQFALAQSDQTTESTALTESGADESSEGEIRVIKSASTTVREYQNQGRTYKLEIDPANTPAYILSDQDGNGRLNNSDTSIDTDVLVPEWTIGSW